MAKSKGSRRRQLQVGHLRLFAVALAASLQENGAESAFEVFGAIRDLADGRRQEQRGTERDALPGGNEPSWLGGSLVHPLVSSHPVRSPSIPDRNVSTQYRKFPCLCKTERSPFSVWVHCVSAAEERARRAAGVAAEGARREAARESLTVPGDLLRAIFLMSNSEPSWANVGKWRAIAGNGGQQQLGGKRAGQLWAIVGSSEPGSCDLTAGTAAIKAVSRVS